MFGSVCNGLRCKHIYQVSMAYLGLAKILDSIQLDGFRKDGGGNSFLKLLRAFLYFQDQRICCFLDAMIGCDGQVGIEAARPYPQPIALQPRIQQQLNTAWSSNEQFSRRASYSDGLRLGVDWAFCSWLQNQVVHEVKPKQSSSRTSFC